MIPAKEIDGELWIRAADAHIQKEAEQRDLRDYFAAKAMQGFIQYSATKGIYAPPDAELAQMSYALADAMLKEREK